MEGQFDWQGSWDDGTAHLVMWDSTELACTPGDTHEGIGSGDGGGGVGTVQSVANKVIQAVLNDPDCLKWLNSKGATVEDYAKLINLPKGGIAVIDDPGDVTTVRDRGDKGNITSQTLNMEDAWTGRPEAVLVVNGLGGFFNSSYNPPGAKEPFDLKVDKAKGFPGKLKGGTPEAQAFIILHEMSHATGVAKPDKGNLDAQKANDKAIEEHCKKALENLKK